MFGGYQYKIATTKSMSIMSILGIIFGSIIVVAGISFLVCWLTMRKMLDKFAISLANKNIENKLDK